MLGSDTSDVWSNIHIPSQDYLESLYGFVKHYKNVHFRKLVDILEYYNEWFKLCFDQDNEELNKLGIQFQTKVPELQEYISDIKEEDPCIYSYLKSQNYIKEYEDESDSESESEFSKTYIDPMFLVDDDEEETFTRDIQNGRREKKDEDEDGWTKKMIKNDKGKFEYEEKKQVIEKVKSEDNEPYFEYIDVTEEKQLIEDDLENVEKMKETEILNVLKRELDKKYKKNINEKNIGVIKFNDFSSFFIEHYEPLKNHYLNLVNKEMFIRMINNKAISKIHLLNLLKGEINKYLIQK